MLHITKKRNVILVLTLLICSAVFITAGCGGGGGGWRRGVTISGTVSGLPGVSAGKAAARSASVKGTEIKADVDITVYAIDDQGNRTGEILATAKTDANGEYSITLPQGVTPASNLVVAVGSDDNLIRSFVTKKKVNISPISELIVNEIVSHGEPLSKYKITDIENILSQAEGNAVDIDLNGQASIRSALSKLKENAKLASDLNASIKIASGVFCGNKVIDKGEGCDDGNTVNGDGCNTNCQVETATPVCGNNTLETGEQCDDGNTVTETCTYGQHSCTVCSATCTSIAGTTAYCGDSTKNGTEGCDDGNTVTETCAYGQTSCTVCNATCQSVVGTTAYCGDSTKNGTEGCDDGNIVNGDGCSSTCAVEVVNPVCGNGTREGAEACDDGNTVTEACTYGQHSCTVCSATCTSVAGAASYAGDGIINGSETCDDGNTVTEACAYGQHSCTVCSATCTSVAGATAYCGDGNLNGTEGCDDGNTVTETCAYGQTSCTVCNATCASVAGATAYCGDGVINGTEQCDGSALGSATCVSQGFTGGTLSCSSCSFNTSACTNPPAYVSQQYVDQCTLPDGLFGAATLRDVFVGGGRKYIADSNNSVVAVMNLNSCSVITNLEVSGLTPESGCISPDGTKIIITWGTAGQFSLFTFNSGTGAYTHVGEFGTPGSGFGQFQDVRGCVFDSSNTLAFIADDGDLQPGNNRVWKWDSSGTPAFVTSFGSKGSTSGKFMNPKGITRDSSDNLFVSDGTGRIQKFSPDGVVDPSYSLTLTATSCLGTDSGNRIYALDGDNKIKAYSNTTGAQIGVVNNGGPSTGDILQGICVAVAPDDSVYNTNMAENTVKRYTKP